MKRIDKIITKLVLFVLLTTSNISIYAQTEEDIKLPDVFPTEDAVWVILVTQTENNPRDVFEPYYKETTYRTSYYLLGDTIIENKKYSKLYFIYGELDSLKVKSCNFYTENQLYVGAIRVEGEQVYLRPHEVIYCIAEDWMCPHIDCIEEDGYPWYKDENIDYTLFGEDVLMYDFSVEESERLYINNYHTNYSIECHHFLATGIIKGSKYAHPWIKGIGSTGGLWFNFDYTPMSGYGVRRGLKSFYYKGKQFYPTEESGINESIADTPKAKAYVSNGVLYIENAEGINSVTVYDAMGRTLLTPNPSPVERGKIAIPLNLNVKGLLLVKVNNEVVKVICE